MYVSKKWDFVYCRDESMYVPTYFYLKSRNHGGVKI